MLAAAPFRNDPAVRVPPFISIRPTPPGWAMPVLTPVVGVKPVELDNCPVTATAAVPLIVSLPLETVPAHGSVGAAEVLFEKRATVSSSAALIVPPLML